jgi:uncharacterized protein
MYKYFEILRKYSTSERAFEIVLRHSLEVLEKSIEVIKKKKLYEQIDFELVVAGCIFHDIGTFEFLEDRKKEGYISHGIIGGEILRKEGLDKEALIAERHIGSGLTKDEIEQNHFPLSSQDFLPVSLEEKLVCYADKFSSKGGKIDNMKSIEAEFRTYGEASYQRFMELRNLFE